MIEFRNLKEKELEQWFVHCMKVFSEKDYDEYALDYYKRHYYNDPWRTIDGIFVAVDCDQIVSTVRVFHREVYFKSKLVKLGGIGEVSTNPNYRGKGLATQLLQMATQYMKQIGIHLSILFTGEERIGFYNQVGYQNIKRKFIETTIETNTKSILVEKITTTEFNQLATIYDQFSNRLNGVIVRNANYWNHWIKAEFQNSYVVKNERNQIIAYLEIKEVDGFYSIRDYGTLDDSLNIKDIVSSIPSIKNKQKVKILYPQTINSLNKEDSVFIKDGTMIQLINPIQIDGREILTTTELVNHLTDFVYWDIDHF